MTRNPGMHVPSPEFRQRLEQDVVKTFRRDSQFGAPSRLFLSRRVGGLLLLIAGLALGWGSAFARGQIQGAEERARLLRAATLERQLATTRLEAADAALQRARTNFQVGLIGRQALATAEADVLEMRDRIARLDLDMSEMTGSGQPVRNELWAPLVNGRDFVLERLRLESTGRQRKLSDAERAHEETERDRRIGLRQAGELAVESAAVEVADARRDMQLVAARMDLRRQFVERAVSQEKIAQQLRVFELNADLERMQAGLQLANRRAALARQRMQTGIGSELDVKRAEIEVLELSAALKLLQAEMVSVEKQ